MSKLKVNGKELGVAKGSQASLCFRDLAKGELFKFPNGTKHYLKVGVVVDQWRHEVFTDDAYLCVDNGNVYGLIEDQRGEGGLIVERLKSGTLTTKE